MFSKTCLVATTVLLTVPAWDVSAQLIFSGYIEGSSNNKYLRISATQSNVNLGDYQIQRFSNGGITPVNIPLGPATLADVCDSWVIGNPSGSILTPDQTNSQVSFNGDDALVLSRTDGTVLDSIGQVGTDPGTEWSGNGVSTLDDSLCRKAAVAAGDTIPDNAFDPSEEWLGFGQDQTFDDIANTSSGGCKCFGPAAAPVPTMMPTQPPAPRSSRIHEVQGSGPQSPLLGVRVSVTAIVIGDFQNRDEDPSRELGGFWIQEEDVNVDNDPATSEGVLVLDGNLVPFVNVHIKDKVTVVGVVREEFGQTAIVAESIQVDARDQMLPSYSPVSLPMDLEQVEGMLVEFEQDLIIIEQFELIRFGQVGLYAGDERPYQFTQLFDPDPVAFAEYTMNRDALFIFYEDGRPGSTNDVDFFDGFSPYSTATAPRMGDVFEHLKGVMDFAFGDFRVRSVINGTNTVESRNPRRKRPPFVGNGPRIAVSNIENYFITLGERGAQSPEEFARQQQKTVTALLGLDADIVGLVELENNFPDVLINLVNALNARCTDDDLYDYVDPGVSKVDSSDAISNGFIYKPSAYEVKGVVAILNDTVAAGLGFDTATTPIFDGVNTNRAVIAVTFVDVHSGECITIATAHLKSKGGNPQSGNNVDQNDGQGAWNFRREQAALATVEWLKTDPTKGGCAREMIMGDLNSYPQEDPVKAFEDAGYANVKDDFDYSFVFDGYRGSLDFILVNEKLEKGLASDALVWNINEDEATAIDYSLGFGRPPQFFDGNVPYRASDHSPVLVGLDNSLKGGKKGGKKNGKKGGKRNACYDNGH